MAFFILKIMEKEVKKSVVNKEKLAEIKAIKSTATKNNSIVIK